eukprot:TRINITY_DN6246_c0_g1_i1.p1 TRINITY_DN6246_c0_g1~~TRINITY_DN6246_c0_g1_i1.p1  ORF type:complete len:932 (-),score=235.95 TRINITY_DN6246_c0_g1_i1:106-2901(-)
MRFFQQSTALLCASAAVLAATGVNADTADCVASAVRRDCGYYGINQEQCESRNCCWSPTQVSGAPWCFFSNGAGSTNNYNVAGVSQKENGLLLDLKLGQGTAAYGADVQDLSVDVTFETADRIHVKITDPNNKRYEVPESVLPSPGAAPVPPGQLNYEFSYTQSPFGFAVTRSSDKEVLFNTTTSKGFVFENQYLQISTALPQDPAVYGFAERIDSLKLNLNEMYTMWSYDIPTPDHQNLYGVHPFYMEVRDGKAHAVFLKNSNAQEVFLESGMLTYFLTGGVLDFYIVVGPTPDMATKQYHEIIGFPHMPPYWSLGWHQCRYGFHNLSEIEGVVSAYKSNNIPLDTIWADIDHMDQYKDFTWDPVNFPVNQVQQFISTLHSQDQQMVVIVDPGIHNQVGYAPYDDGIEKNLFVKRSNGDVFIGKVWPGTTAFPDFFHPNTSDYWYGLIKGFLDTTPLDGLWIDMNEISNFCNGFCNALDTEEVISTNEADDSSVFDPVSPPYKINNANHYGALNEKTLDMDCTHYGDNMLEYNVHSLFGLTESIATRAALEKYYGKRSFVLTRSTFPGSGHHVAHWLGDNHANFKSMRDSFPGAMLFNILGVPLVGSDICGFMENADEELCNRWHAVGAFYPFARNHQAMGTNFKYPYMWDSVKQTAIKSLGARYSLLNYYYTLFFNAHMNGGTVMRPLFYEFPEDKNTLGIDQQFMIGPALLFSPCMVEGALSVNAYFPEGRWFDYWTLEEVPASYSKTNQTISTPWDAIPIYYRGGFIVPSQTPALTSAETRSNPFTLTVALDYGLKAVGEIYFDDGEDLDVGAKALHVSFNADAGSLRAAVNQNTYDQADNVLVNKVVILGLNAAPKSISLNGSPVQFSFDSSVKVLTVDNLNTKLAEFEELSWSSAEVASVSGNKKHKKQPCKKHKKLPVVAIDTE